MKTLLYNIAYGTGAPNSYYDHITKLHHYLRTSHRHLEDITKFIKNADPDLVGLVEVDTGSYRTRYTNQVETITNQLDIKHYYSNKYGRRSIHRKFPILKKQANAVLHKDELLEVKNDYFPIGTKRLIIHLRFEKFDYILLHMALKKSVRKKQFEYLSKILPKDRPLIIAGDMNTFSGEIELELLKRNNNLINPNTEGLPTFPSWKPKRQLDYILCSKEIKPINVEVPQIRHSDHLPIILEFDI